MASSIDKMVIATDHSNIDSKRLWVGQYPTFTISIGLHKK